MASGHSFFICSWIILYPWSSYALSLYNPNVSAAVVMRFPAKLSELDSLQSTDHNHYISVRYNIFSLFSGKMKKYRFRGTCNKWEWCRCPLSGHLESLCFCSSGWELLPPEHHSAHFTPYKWISAEAFFPFLVLCLAGSSSSVLAQNRDVACLLLL